MRTGCRPHIVNGRHPQVGAAILHVASSSSSVLSRALSVSGAGICKVRSRGQSNSEPDWIAPCRVSLLHEITSIATSEMSTQHAALLSCVRLRSDMVVDRRKPAHCWTMSSQG